MADVYYFISDLHIGGDEQLQQVDFLDELLAFLEELEENDEDAELIINGDAFGLWEFTGVEGRGKFDALLDRYPELFEQLEATGREIPITLIPGNHDCRRLPGVRGSTGGVQRHAGAGGVDPTDSR